MMARKAFPVLSMEFSFPSNPRQASEFLEGAFSSASHSLVLSQQSFKFFRKQSPLNLSFKISFVEINSRTEMVKNGT